MASKAIPIKDYALCKKKIVSREFLKCTSCNRFLDVTCTSNVRKQNNAVSSQQKTTPKLSDQSLWNDQIASAVVQFLATEFTLSTNYFVTMRKKFLINVGTESSYQSLSD